MSEINEMLKNRKCRNKFKCLQGFFFSYGGMR